MAPPGATECRLLLARATNAEQASRVGNQSGGRVFLFLYTDDFPRDPDPYGNLWDLVEASGGAIA